MCALGKPETDLNNDWLPGAKWPQIPLFGGQQQHKQLAN
jgi:hypothetical protein